MTDPLIDTPAFREAVEAWCVAMYGNDIDQPDIERATRGILAAAPHLERHYREKFSAELRAEAKRCDPTGAYPRGPGRWLDAADHLTREGT